MPQYMGHVQRGWPTVCPNCQSETDWVHTKSDVDEVAAKQTAYFVPVFVRNCTQDQMKLTRKAYTDLSVGRIPKPANRLPQGVKA